MEWTQIMPIAIPVILLVVEYYLGKTKAVESNSSLELVERLLTAVAGIFKR